MYSLLKGVRRSCSSVRLCLGSARLYLVDCSRNRFGEKAKFLAYLQSETVAETRCEKGMMMAVDWLTLPSTEMSLCPAAMEQKEASRGTSINVRSGMNQLQLMKKAPPVAATRGGLLQEAAKYLVRGILLGMLFEGTFLMFSFENRIRRSTTSKQLEEVKLLEEETDKRIRKGLPPLVDITFLRDKTVQKLQENQEKIV